MSENTREEAYNRVFDYIKHNTTTLANQKAVREQQLKLSLVAHGDLDSDEVNKALKALGEQEKIVYGSGWITVNIDNVWLKDALSYVVENGDSPKEFVKVANRRLHG